MLAFLLAALLATLLLAACVAPVAMPAAAPTAILVPERVAFDVAPGGQPVAVTLPVTQPLPSLVMLNAGTITVTETITGEAEPPAVVIPVQGAFTIPVFGAHPAGGFRRG